MTRPNIDSVVNMVSYFMHAPRSTHLHVVKIIFRYLKGTLKFGLFLHSNSSPTIYIAYSNADQADSLDTRRSTTSYAVFLGKNLISQRLKKQPYVYKSSTKAKYRVIAYTASESIWLRQLLVDLVYFFDDL